LVVKYYASELEIYCWSAAVVLSFNQETRAKNAMFEISYCESGATSILRSKMMKKKENKTLSRN